MAHHGARPDGAVWSALEGTQDPASFLVAARRSSLAAWLEGIEANTPRPDAERSLRRVWVGRVREVAAWPPPSWEAAVRWWEALPFLPALDDVFASKAPSPRWFEDPELQPVASATDPEARSRALALRGWQALTPTAEAPPLAERWLREFEERLPSNEPAGRRGARALLEAVRPREKPSSAERSRPSPDPSDRTKLEERLARGFRRFHGTAGALFHHLALFALEGQRLRGELVRRLQLPGAQGNWTWA